MARFLTPEEIEALRDRPQRASTLAEAIEMAIKNIHDHYSAEPQVMMVSSTGHILPLDNPALLIPGARFEVVDIEWQTRTLSLNPASWPQPRCGWHWLTHFWQHGWARPRRMISKVRLLN